jgi:hypothetical protein
MHRRGAGDLEHPGKKCATCRKCGGEPCQWRDVESSSSVGCCVPLLACPRVTPRPGNLTATCRLKSQFPWGGLRDIYRRHGNYVVLTFEDLRFCEIMAMSLAVHGPAVNCRTGAFSTPQFKPDPRLGRTLRNVCTPGYHRAIAKADESSEVGLRRTVGKRDRLA